MAPRPACDKASEPTDDPVLRERLRMPCTRLWPSLWR